MKKKNRRTLKYKFSDLIEIRFICYISLLQADGDTHSPRVLDLGAVTVLEELAGSVTAVDTEIIPGEGTHEVKVYFLLLEALEAGVMFNLVDLVMIFHLGIVIPVQDSSDTNFKLLDNSLLEHQGELQGPHVQVRCAVLNLIDVIVGIS